MKMVSQKSILLLSLVTSLIWGEQKTLDSLMFGVTIDNPWNVSQVATALSSHTVKPTARIVFDEYEENVNAADYADILPKISESAIIMGELLDSYYLPNYPLARYLSRLNDFIDTAGEWVDIWEIGNEVNGDWTGRPDSVAEKIEGAYQICKSKGLATAVNFYYNKPCYYNKYQHEMFNWINNNVSDDMKNGLDYVFFSYYEDDCEDVILTEAEWQVVFDSLATVFPNSKIGFGEVGTTKNNAKKAEYMRRYYTLKITTPNYVGGYFWWYYSDDCVPHTKALWDTLDTIVKTWIGSTGIDKSGGVQFFDKSSGYACHCGKNGIEAKLELYDLKGRCIKLNSADYRLFLKNKTCSNGVFICRYTQNGTVIANHKVIRMQE